MKIYKRAAAGIISSAISVVMLGTSIMAATGTDINKSVIDSSRTGTIVIHKIVENDGTLTNADGLASDEEYTVVNNIGFDCIKLADIQDVSGIIISTDGKIDWANEANVQIGAYYIPNDNLQKIMAAAGVIPEATYIKSALNDSGSTLTYEFNDEKAASLLTAEQTAVNSALEKLNQAAAALTKARNNYSSALAGARLSAVNSNSADSTYSNALSVYESAISAYSKAENGANVAAKQLAAESTGYANAAEQIVNAKNSLDEATKNYSSDEGTMNKLAQAHLKLTEAENSSRTASENLSDASVEKSVTSENLKKAGEALKAAESILKEAMNAEEKSSTGSSDSETGTENAIKSATEQVEAALNYKKSAEEADTQAQEALKKASDTAADAAQALDEAILAFNTAMNNNNEKYGIFKDAVSQMTQANSAFAAAETAKAKAQEVYDKAVQEQSEASDNLDKAKQALNNADAARLNAASTKAVSDAELSNYENAKTSAQSAYDNAMETYENAVSALDSKAEDNGIVKVYTTEQLESAWKQFITTMGEEYVSSWVAANSGTVKSNSASTYGYESGEYTDDNGTASFAGLELGLYAVAETDISYHDGIAGAWNDGTSGYINNDSMNTYENGTYTIQAVDGFGRETSHEYSAGEYYEESINPEGPVIETPCAPFLVSVPTTNTTNTDSSMVADGDNYGETGSVWQYTVDVYPKNQTTAIYKRIVDPDEADGNETLRTSEDYQIGDLIEQVIWADAPTLLAGYLNGSSDDGNGGVDGDLADNNAADSTNRHLGYVISDTMSAGITFDKVTKVAVIPKSQLTDNTGYTEVYTDGDGTVVSAAEALNSSGKLNVTRKYYDNENKEITAEVFAERTGVSASEATAYSVTDSNGNVTETGKTYKAAEGYTGSYYVTEVSYKKTVVSGTSSAIPGNVSAFDITYDASDSEGFLLDAGDYMVINTDDNSVNMTNAAGDVKTIIDKGTHGFAVMLTEAGLAKLNARTVDSVVVVYLDSILNKDAKIGEVAENVNYPTLDWVNTNTSFRTIKGNHVYDYTYELQLRKEGVVNGSNVKFIVSRDDTNDIAQVTEKDLTDYVSQLSFYGQGDSMRFVKEDDGIYHVWGYLDSENTDEGDPASSYETSVVNGITYNTVTPAEDGLLVLKGLDSDTYTFEEIRTEDENNLLAGTFEVEITAQDSEIDSLRDGMICTAKVKSGNSDPIDITVGVSGKTTGQDITDTVTTNLGIAAMTINNYDSVDLRTGGTGRWLYYVIGGIVAGICALIIFAVRRKENEIEN